MSQRGTPSIVRHRAALRRPRRDLLARTALCGALVGFAAFALPAGAATPIAPPGLPVLADASPQVNTGGVLPNIVTSESEIDVTLHAPRTVIDWASYNLAAGNAVKYAFDARNWIVLNRIQDTSPTTIAGVVEGRVNGAYGGNIWFAAPNGMIFGAGAKIDAGGILVSAASPDLAGFLDPNNLMFNFSGAEVVDGTPIGMQAGSSINGHGGLVALIAPTIVTEAGATVTGQNGSNVLYGATTGYQLRLAQGAPGDFDLVDFLIPDSEAGSGSAIGLDLQNSTTANSVFVAMVSRADASSAVINLQGMITAQAATADGGDIILSGGGGIAGKAIGPNQGGTATDIYLHLASASRDIQLKTNGQVFGQPFARPPPPNGSGNGFVSGNVNGNGCSCEALAPGAGSPLLTPGGLLHSATDSTQTSQLAAGRDIGLLATNTIALGSAQAGRDLMTDSVALQANNLGAGQAMVLNTGAGDLKAASVSVGGGGSLTSSGAIQIDSLVLTGAQPLAVKAATDVLIGGGSGGTITLSAGRDATVNMGSATFDTVTAGGTAKVQAGSLTIGTIKAQQVLVQGGSVSITSATSAGDVQVSGGSATVATATAGGDIVIQASGGTASLTNAVITGAGHMVSVQAAGGDALLGLGTGSVSGAAKVSVQASQDAIVDLPTALPGTLSVGAGRDATLRAPTVVFDAVTAGRDITLTGTAGDFSSTRNLVATRNITIGAAGALQLADITASSGSITLTGTSVTAGALNAGQDLTLKALNGGVTAGAVNAGQDLTLKALNGGVKLTSFKAGRDLIVQTATLSLGQQLAPIGRDVAITSPGDFTAASDLAAGRNFTLSVGGVATLNGVTAAGAVDIVAKDLTLGGTLTAANVQVESATGDLRVGGSSADGAPASGLWLDNAEFGRIHATGQVNLYAGPTQGTPRGDLTVLALDVSPQSTPQVNFLVGGGHNALVQGVVAPAASGGVIHIGDNANTAWQPTSILVSGTLGSATFSGGAYTDVHAFDEVRLFATQDIIIGTQRFIGLIQAAADADIEIGRNKPTGVAATGAERNRVLVAAAKLELSASGKVVSQNTAPTVAQSVGLFLTAGNGQPDLLIDPPQLVDLYGSFISQSGVVVTSFPAGSGVAFAIVDPAGNPAAMPVGAVYRFNSCGIGTSQCAAVGTVTANLQQNTPVLSSSTGAALGSDLGAGSDNGDGSSGEGSSGGSSGGKAGSRNANERNSGPSVLSVAPVETDELLTDPVVTGAGSEEIWRKHAPTPTPAQGAKP